MKSARYSRLNKNRLAEIVFLGFSGKYPNLDSNLFEACWHAAYDQAESEVLKRLVISVLAEHLAPFQKVAPEAFTHLMSKFSPPPRIVYRCPVSNGHLFIPVKRRTEFNRIELSSSPLLQKPSGDIEMLENPLMLFDHVLSAVDRFKPVPEKIDRTRAGILNSFENLACGICHKLIRKALEKDDADRMPLPADALMYYERLVTTGHPVHPLTKYRSNVDLKDTFRIAPEYDNTVSVGFVAVKKDFFHCSRLFPDRTPVWETPPLETLLASLLPNGVDPAGYRFIPVHSWQYRHWLKRIFKKDMEEKAVILLGEDLLKGAPTLSIRTLYVESFGQSFFLKLPVNLQTTSYFRTVSPNATQNGVALARICSRIRRRHRVFQDRTCFLLETVGGYYSRIQADAMTPDDIAVSKQLGYIVRQSPYEIIDADEIPLVTTVLTDPNRKTSRPVLYDLISLDGKTTAPSRNARAWFNAFLDVSIPGLLTLMSCYGIGFEAHQQNTLLVISRATGKPTRFLLRDFGGIRVSLRRLQKMGFKTDFFPQSVTVKDSMTEVRNKLFYAFYQSVLGELVFALTSEYGIHEMELWRMVYDKSVRTFDRLKETHPYPEWVDADFKSFVSPRWQFKSLLSMSLIDSGSDYVYTAVSNPFHEIHKTKMMSERGFFES